MTNMNYQKPQLYFLLLALAGVFILTFLILRPFLYALVLAAVFAFVFHPIYQRMIKHLRGRRGLAAFATLLIVFVCIVTPSTFLGIQIFQEAQGLYFSLIEDDGKGIVLATLNDLLERIQKYIPAAQGFTIDLDQYIKQGLDWLVQHLGSILGSFTKMAINSFLFLVALYYLLKDGQKLKAAIISLSPLSNADNEIIASKLGITINSVIKGNLLIALTQGALATLGFLIFGVPSPVLWGSVTAIAALIPGIGTALVLAPAIVFLFLTGEVSSGIGLLIWGVVAVGLIDNFLSPKLIERGTRLHPLIILLSIFGGVGFFGPIGFLLGPLIISLLFALIDIYFTVRKPH
jgi:predicted PurR-regulated permease PerM